MFWNCENNMVDKYFARDLGDRLDISGLQAYVDSGNSLIIKLKSF